MTRRDPNFVDVHVGSRIRMRRQFVGMSQEKLGELLGITFQQVQKYEKGSNRISASRLYYTAKILGVPVQFFFEELPGSEDRSSQDGTREQDTVLSVVDECRGHRPRKGLPRSRQLQQAQTDRKRGAAHCRGQGLKSASVRASDLM